MGEQRACCDTVTGDGHRDCPTTGTNAHGVAMCVCKRFGPPHAWEPGEACSPTRAVPQPAKTSGEPVDLLAALQRSIAAAKAAPPASLSAQTEEDGRDV